MKRITHKDVERACARLNKARGLTYPSRGYIQWADIKGDGRNRRGLYVQINDNGGVTSSNLRGKTMRETIKLLDFARLLNRVENFVVIIRATHERGAMQVAALDELNRRGLWLSDDMKRQAGLN